MTSIFRLFFMLLQEQYLHFVRNTYPLYYFYQILFCVSTYSIDILYVLQIYEWAAMIFVITSQKNRRLEEITYDLHTTNLKDKRSYSRGRDGYNNYRRDEHRLQACFRFYLAYKIFFALCITLF